MFLLYVHVGGC